jgi:hypothetical protein
MRADRMPKMGLQWGQEIDGKKQAKRTDWRLIL